MKRETLIKFALVFVIVAVVVGLDQWTKQIASDRLATTRNGHFNHYIHLTVPPESEGKTLKEYLSTEFAPSNTEAELNGILRGVTDDGGVFLSPDKALTAGDKIEVRRREVVVLEGYWDHQYTRNPGAAFSFLADADESLRLPFFIATSSIAIIIMLWFLAGVGLEQQILIWGLAFVTGGALGNLIDRINYGYVIDFVVWKWTDAYRWPTFNIADAFICIGVGLMVIEMIRDTIRERREAAEKKKEAPAS